MDMDNEQPAADGAKAESAAQKKERLDQIGSFAGFLTSQMVDAIGAKDNALGWEDAVVAAGLAVRAVGEIAAILTARQTGKEASAEDIALRIDALMAKARSIKVATMRVESEEEAQAYMAGVEKGFH